MNNAHVDLLRKCGWTTLLEPVSNTEVKIGMQGILPKVLIFFNFNYYAICVRACADECESGPHWKLARVARQNIHTLGAVFP